MLLKLLPHFSLAKLTIDTKKLPLVLDAYVTPTSQFMFSLIHVQYTYVLLMWVLYLLLSRGHLNIKMPSYWCMFRDLYY